MAHMTFSETIVDRVRALVKAPADIQDLAFELTEW
jgi:hypothetical protein